MQLQHFRSDWNGLKSDKPYHKKPTINQVKTAMNTKPIYSGGCVIIADINMVEVRNIVDNGIAGNKYRDFYRIIN